jgi:transcriptional regulator with XRE-family HTH domain
VDIFRLISFLIRQLNMITLGKRIQELRKENKITQLELGEKINISHPQIVRYENKDVQPPADVLKRLADLFGVSIDYIVNGNTNDKAQQSLKDAEIIKEFQKVEALPEEEKNTIVRVVSALVRDYQTKQAYAI